MRKMKLKTSAIIIMAVLFLLSAIALAGDLNPPAGTPSPTMHTLDEIYYKINAIAGSSSVPKTGQTTCYNTSGGSIDCTADGGPGQDGDLQKGIEWPNPRYTINGDGTVTDNFTGLVWLQNANPDGASMGWAEAFDFCNSLASGAAGLTDGSVAGDWRMPNIRELFSLVNFAYGTPAISNTAGTGQWAPGEPFNNLQISKEYWRGATQKSCNIKQPLANLLQCYC